MADNKTGEDQYRRTKFNVDEITFNGNKGIFYKRDAEAKKDEKTGKYPKTAITKEGEPLEVVFLKIRRVLNYYNPKGGMRTNEHNSKADKVVLYTPNGKEYGTAAEIRTKYPQLRTQQAVYCYLPATQEVARVVIKGSSLGSEYKHPEGVRKFYDYFDAFKSDESTKEFLTILKPVTEPGPQGDYHAITFVKGDKLTPEVQEVVNAHVDAVDGKIKAVDAKLQAGFGKDTPSAPVETEDEDGEEKESYPTAETEDINPDDIPF